MKSVTKNRLPNHIITQLAEKCFGENIQIDSIKELSGGAFNAVYQLSLSVGDEQAKELVFKVSPDSNVRVLTYEKEIIRTEVNVAEVMHGAGVAVPKVLAHDFSRELIDADYFFMEKLQGETLYSMKRRLSAAQMDAIKEDLGKNAAMIHSVKGKYFGYIKESASFHYSSWQDAFRSFIKNIIHDGKKGKVRLPYIKILSTLEPFWFLLDEIKIPTLINFDMWEKNIFVIRQDNNYHIEGIIDHERALFGDPLMEFVGSRSFIDKDYIKEKALCNGYNSVSPKPIMVTKNDRIRILMYNIYLDMIMAVEIYRYSLPVKAGMYSYALANLHKHLSELKKMETAVPLVK